MHNYLLFFKHSHIYIYIYLFIVVVIICMVSLTLHVYVFLLHYLWLICLATLSLTLSQCQISQKNWHLQLSLLYYIRNIFFKMLQIKHKHTNFKPQSQKQNMNFKNWQITLNRWNSTGEVWLDFSLNLIICFI